MLRAVLIATSIMTITGCGTGSGAAGVAGPAAGGAPPSAVRDTLSVAAGGSIDLRIGQSASVQGSGVAFRLVDVRQDSRCPIGAQCVTAGNVQAVVDTRTSQGASGQFILHLTADAQFPSSVVIGSHEIRFGALTPQPQVNGPAISPSSYVATFTVSRL